MESNKEEVFDENADLGNDEEIKTDVQVSDLWCDNSTFERNFFEFSGNSGVQKS